ncbi:MAG: hypothetical protein U0790_06300 [Isosphaeraceae bacterium]
MPRDPGLFKFVGSAIADRAGRAIDLVSAGVSGTPVRNCGPYTPTRQLL